MRKARRRRRDLEAEVDDELAFHLDMRAKELVDAGVDPVEARQRATERFGDVGRIRRGYVRVQRWRALRSGLAHAVAESGQDLRLAARQLRRSPGFALVVVASVALGIGVNTAVFTVVDSVLLRPLPYPESDRIVRIWGTRETEGARSTNLSPPDVRDFARENGTLASLAPLATSTATVTGVGDAATVREALATPSIFDVLAVAPALGRAFREAEAVPGGPDVVILTHGYWARVLGSDPAVLGRSLTIDGTPHEIVGVLPPDLPIPTLDAAAQPDLLRPLRTGPQNGRGGRWLHAVARLAPDATVSDATTDLSRIATTLRGAYPETNTDRGVRAESLRDATVGPAARGLWILQGAVALVLLIVCVNVANLLTVQGTVRSSELAVRRALGAGQGRLARQLLVEAALLVGVGALGGLALSYASVRLLAVMPGAALPRADEISLNGSVLAACAALAVVTGTLFSLAPLVQSLRSDVRSGLGGAGGGIRSSLPRLRSGLVALEAALALVLLVGAGLFARSFQRLVGEESGVDPEGTTVVEVALPPGRYGETESIGSFYSAWLGRLASTPGLDAVGAVNNLPFLYESCDGFGLPDRPAPAPGEDDCASTQLSTPGYLSAAGIPLVEGRDFTRSDGPEGRPVAVVSESFARRYWPGEPAVGRLVEYNGIAREIVGVSGAVRRRGLAEEAPPELFLPHAQEPWDRQMFVLVRSSLSPQDVVARVRASLREEDAGVPVGRILPLEGLVTGSVAGPRFRALALGAFALLALTLAGVGIYGVTAFTISARKRELGIRMALGAGATKVRLLVLRDALRIVGAGLGVGLAAATAAVRAIRELLYEVEPLDPPTLGLAAGLLLLVAAMGSHLAARRATVEDPLSALRDD